MNTKEQINQFINEEYIRFGFIASEGHSPELGFKLTNVNTDSSDTFKVGSVDEAEELVISFIPSAIKGYIFTNDTFLEEKPLFLRVKVILP